MKIDNALAGVMFAVLVANVVFLLWYVFVGYQSCFHSDSAAKVLLAREIYDTGDFFPTDWNYVNGDLFVFFGHVFIIPLLAFMPAGFMVHAIAGAIFAGLILYGVWLVTGLGDLPVWRRVAVVAVMASGISDLMAENLYGQVSYGLVVFFYCYIIYFSSQYLSAEGKIKLKWAMLFIVLLVFAYWANPKRAIIYYELPLLAALGWLILSSYTQDKLKYFNLIGLSFLSAMAGTGLHMVSIAKVNNILGAANARWLPFEGIISNIALTFKGLYAQLGGCCQPMNHFFLKMVCMGGYALLSPVWR